MVMEHCLAWISRKGSIRRIKTYSLLILFFMGFYQTTCAGDLKQSSVDETADREKRATWQFARSRIREEILKKDNSVPPNYDEEIPTEIQCDLYVDSVDAISETSMDFKVNVLMELRWENYELVRGLNFGKTVYVEFDSKTVEQLWTPDLFFPNEKDAYYHEVMMPNKMLRIYYNGTSIYSSRLSLTLNCYMRLKHYPFDEQVCKIEIMSFSFTQEQMLISWRNVTTNQNIELPQFQLKNVSQAECDTAKLNAASYTQNHSCLVARFAFVRNVGYYVVQMYIPCILVVTLSWISFWLNVNSVPGRISLGVLTVLTITTQSSTINASLPRVSYTKAIDIYTSTCLVFVFAALIEFAMVNVLSRSDSENVKLFNIRKLFSIPKFGEVDGPRQSAYDSTFQAVRTDDVRIDIPEKTEANAKQRRGIIYAIYLDMASRLIFPLVFIIFNMVYWIYYSNMEHNDNK